MIRIPAVLGKARSGALLLSALSLFSACSGDQTAPTPARPTPATPGPIATLSVEPRSVLLEAGGSMQLRVLAQDANGLVISSVQVIWSSTDADVAMVSQSGVVRGVKLGSTSVSAQSGAVSATAAVTVVAQSRSTGVSGVAFSHFDRWPTTQLWIGGVVHEIGMWDLDAAYEPAWSPNGTLLARTAVSGADGWAGIVVSDAAATYGYSIGSNGYGTNTGPHCPVWSADGASVLYGAGNTIRSVGLVELGSDHTVISVGAGAACPAVSADGKRLAYISGPRGALEVHVAAMDGGGDAVVATAAADSSPPAWSPDGARLVYAGYASRQAAAAGAGPGLWVVSADGSVRQPLTRSDTGTNDSQPDWSPDGVHIVFARRIAEGGIFEINADGTRLRQLTAGGVADSWPRYRPSAADEGQSP
jgi:hypothetical protein